jgi:hypothetical protein
MITHRALALLALPCLLLAASARADVPAPRSVILTGDFTVSYQRFSSSAENSSSITILQLAPEADWVLPSNVTVGGKLMFTHLEEGSKSYDAYGLVGQVGYMAAVGPNLAIWPRGGFGYEKGFLEFGPLAASIPVKAFFLEASLMILYSPVPHFFVGLGPVFSHQFTASVESNGVSNDVDKVTMFGLQSIIGGWF